MIRIDNRLVEFSRSVADGEFKPQVSLYNSQEDINGIMNSLKGKIIKLDSLHGFIEYDIDKRITYSVLKEDIYKIGDIVKFEIHQKQVANSEIAFPVAVNLSLISARKILREKSFKLEIVAEKYNHSIKQIAEILTLNGFNVEEKPTAEIGEEEYLILESHFDQIENTQIENNEKIERGSVINTNILEVIHPSLIVVEFFNNRKGFLYLNNISWNKSRSERILKNTKKGDEIQIVYLGDDENSNPIVSKKHLTPRPNETEFWENIKIGSLLEGQIIEILVNVVIIELENNLYGKLLKPNNFINLIGDHLQFEVLKKDESSLYVDLAIRSAINKLLTEEKPSVLSVDKAEVSIIKSSYESFESDLQSLDSFKKSIYFNFCNEEQEEFFVQAFNFNPFLFSNSIDIKLSLHIQFGLNLPAWESDFKNKLIPYLNADIKLNITEQDALNHLSKEKYWFRINRFFSKGKEQIRWALFNEEYFLSGFVDTNSFNFIVLSLAIQRIRKDKSLEKNRNLASGTFLYDSKILFSSPFQDNPIEYNKEEIFKLLDDKTKAFEIIRDLKEESGALLMEEGLSLQIFDRFLEFQENILKKGNATNRVWIDAQFKNVTSDLGELSIELPDDLEDLCEGNTLTSLVTIRTIQLSTKNARDEEFVFFSDALLEIIPKGSRLHFRNDDILLDDLKEGFYIEPKISLRQFQVQREVLQDFFAKKIKLRHIESLLLRPEKIQAPEMLELNFFNDILKLTEEESHQNNQVKSVKKSVGNKNIFLIQGPPGTGKTTVIAEIVQQLVAKGEKILVTSQTHIAVDNVLEKLSKNSNLSLLRLGNINRVKEELTHYHKEKQVEIYSNYFTDSIKLNIQLANQYIISSGKLVKNDLVDFATENHNYPEDIKEELMTNNLKFIDSLLELDYKKVVELPVILEDWANNISNELETLILPLMYSSIDVVFATCIGVRTDRELSQYNVVFDTVIIDEAGKANLSESIAAISMAKKVILVGDQMQLPPYIDGSLLDPNEKHSFPNTKFGSKYLEEDIQHALRTSFFEFLVNRIKGENFPKSNIEMLNYQHRMHPHIGEFISEAFYNGELKMGDKTAQNVLPMPSPFDKQVVFIDTSTADNPFEIKVGVSVKNDTEAQCISQLVVPKLISYGLTSKDFAIVAPYKSQVNNIKKHLSDSAMYDQIDVSTLDSFQGMEFDVIVFSFTRSAFNTKVGFLDDARRLNVAFSRAKKKLILIGNSETLLDKNSHYDQLFNYTELFKKLVKISKNQDIGNFVNVTDFTDLKSRFQTQIGKFKIGDSYLCKLKLTFENEKYLGHIFFINGSTLEGMYRDSYKEFAYDSDAEYNMFVTGIDYQNERIQLSPKQTVKSTFFDKYKIGDEINVSYKQTIDPGHLFQIEADFDCFMYDPAKLKRYQTNEFYDLFIVKIDRKKMRVEVGETKAQFKKPLKRVKRDFQNKNFQNQAKKLKFFNVHKIGDLIEGNYINSTNFGHFFRIENSFDGLVFDKVKKHANLIIGRTYVLQIVKLDSIKGNVSLEIKNI
ncbi:AAA domain-containing protein [Yeosuana sp.]|uniref:AAA domain-containing protein n=1 Tax=Yeosuana sp. TaxID=2529388 RepID=UPI00405515BE